MPSPESSQTERTTARKTFSSTFGGLDYRLLQKPSLQALLQTPALQALLQTPSLQALLRRAATILHHAVDRPPRSRTQYPPDGCRGPRREGQGFGKEEALSTELPRLTAKDEQGRSQVGDEQAGRDRDGTCRRRSAGENVDNGSGKRRTLERRCGVAHPATATPEQSAHDGHGVVSVHGMPAACFGQQLCLSRISALNCRALLLLPLPRFSMHSIWPAATAPRKSSRPSPETSGSRRTSRARSWPHLGRR